MEDQYANQVTSGNRPWNSEAAFDQELHAQFQGLELAGQQFQEPIRLANVQEIVDVHWQDCKPLISGAAEPMTPEKGWHKSVTLDLRNYLVQKIVETILPPNDFRAALDKQVPVQNLFACALKVEKESYELSNSQSEYHHRIEEKTYKMQQELEEKRRKHKEELQQMGAQGSQQMDVPVLPPDSAMAAPSDDSRWGAAAASNQQFQLCQASQRSQQQLFEAQRLAEMQEMVGDESRRVFIPPSKEWHQSLNQGTRNYIVQKIVETIFPTPDLSILEDQRMDNVVAYAWKVEGEYYEAANSRPEYYHLIAEKTYKLQKELQDIRMRRKQQADQVQGAQQMDDGGAEASNQVLIEQQNQHFQQFPPSKEWHATVTPELRNCLVQKIVKAICPTSLDPSTPAFDEGRMAHLVAYAWNVEREFYATCNTRSEYYHRIAEKIYKIQQELEAKRRRREEEQQQQMG